MSLWEALVLGLVQGLTEFLPVSSSGHLVLVPHLFGWESPTTSFDLVLHLGTMAAVFIYFRRDIIGMLAAFFLSGRDAWERRRLGLLILLGTLPAVLAGGFFEKTFESFFDEPAQVGAFLLVTGVALMAGEAVARRQRRIGQLKVSDSVLIGLAQAAAIAPGISRSGATIAAGLSLGLKREAAARFSFLLSIPIITAASAFRLRHGLAEGVGGEGMEVVAAGFFAAAVTGFLAIKFLLAFVQRYSLKVFAYYCWAVGAAVIIIWLLTQ